MKKWFIKFLCFLMILSIMPLQIVKASDTDFQESNEAGEVIAEGEYVIYYDLEGNVYSEQDLIDNNKSRDVLFEMGMPWRAVRWPSYLEVTIQAVDALKVAQIYKFQVTVTLTEWSDYIYAQETKTIFPGGTSVASLVFKLNHTCIKGVTYYLAFNTYIELLNGEPLNGRRMYFTEPIGF